MNTNSSFQIKNTNAYISIAFFQRIRENKLYETMIRKYRLVSSILSLKTFEIKLLISRSIRYYIIK